MNMLSNRFFLLFGSTFAFLLAAGAGTLLVGYEPWGVPDDRREEYQAILAKWDRQDALEEHWADKAKPVVAAGKTQHEFGLHEPGETLSHSFTVENRGDKPLSLALHDTGCECVTAEIPEQPVAPGSQSKIVVSVQNDKPEHRYHWVSINTSDPLTEQIKFRVGGTVRSEFVTPDSVSFEPSDPLQRCEGSFLVHSQLWHDMEVADVKIDDRQVFDWHAEPLPADSPQLAKLNARSMWRVRLWTSGARHGEYSGKLQVTLAANQKQKEVVRELTYAGRVRQPIVFLSPDIHMKDGLDIGTIVSGKQEEFHLVVRLRGDLQRELEVLDIKPNQLRASLKPTNVEGDYRLTVTVPEDCPMVVFNQSQQHGYVEVGDPKDQQFSNWFPLHGAVVTLSE